MILCPCSWCAGRRSGPIRLFLEPFRRRRIDFAKPVEVYRNLRAPGITYSVRQGGRVVAHTTAVMLQDATFVVREAGRQRVLSTGHKNVHAWVRGRIVCSAWGTSCDLEREKREHAKARGYEYRGGLAARARYNPWVAPTFVTLVTTPPKPLRRAVGVMLDETGISYCY